MGIRYTKKQDEQELKNVADPWNIIGIGRVMPISTRDVQKVSLCGGLTDIEIATYLDGNADADLQMRVINAAQQDATLRDLLATAADIDEEILQIHQKDGSKTLPLASLAATEAGETHTCGMRCEAFILQRYGIPCDEAELIDEARCQGWLQQGGTRIGNIGNVLEKKGLIVTKEFEYTLEALSRLLSEGKHVIAVVDGGELVGERRAEAYEDRYIGEIPDHALAG